jgi:uncharacterized membrane protein HdeD (DUF308 family)
MKFKNIKIAPLPGSFLVMSIIGLIISIIYIIKPYPSFGFAFALVFGIMLISSLISMHYSEDIDLIEEPYTKKVIKKN